MSKEAKFISNEEFEKARKNPDNIRTIKAACSSYARSLPPSVLKACGDTGLWKCLQKHEEGHNQKFTSSLYRFVNWECLREIYFNRPRCEELIDVGKPDNTAYVTVMVDQCLDILEPLHREMVVARYINKRTLEDIGKEHGYSKTGVKNIIDRSIKVMRQFAKDK
jgi:DNA-directed RNA polymerase specialized sigma24 family protein